MASSAPLALPQPPPGDIPSASSISETLLASDSFHPPTSTAVPPEQPNSRRSIPPASIRDRAETLSSTTSSSSVRRKPLPVTASPLATRYSSGDHLAKALDLPVQTLSGRPYAADSPTLPGFPPTSSKAATLNPPAARASVSSRLLPSSTALTSGTSHYPSNGFDSDLQQQKQHHHPLLPVSPNPNLDLDPGASPSAIAVLKKTSPTVTPLEHARLPSASAYASISDVASPWLSETSSASLSQSARSIFSTIPTSPFLLPNVDLSASLNEPDNSHTTAQRAKSDSLGRTKPGPFTDWGGNISPQSPATTYSETSISPLASPHSSESKFSTAIPHASPTGPSRSKLAHIDVPKANAKSDSYFTCAHLQLPLSTPGTPLQIDAMEKELEEISSELAASIRREMDLEDLVERLQSDATNTSNAGRRTSDYFSDSGTSSVKYGGESESKQDELDRAIRKNEQEKAQMRLDLTNTVQEERSKRKQLEQQIRNLEEKASHVDLASINSLDASGRLRELEATCEDLRRRLTEERSIKENFEDLLSALKSDLHNAHNERDNLRDEIVPQLRARVEGLEAQAAEHERFTYEQTKTQQELQTLKNENLTLINAQKMQMEMQSQMKRFNSIAEESITFTKNRSNSVSQGSLTRSSSRPSSLSRSLTVKMPESREALADRVKDIELQRDALHQALKSLLDRQDHQNRENEKKIRQLETELERALSTSPQHQGYDKEVKHLRDEMNTLRARADEAIQQKWQCEKGLAGLKMDLERAEQEIASLRRLLDERDIFMPGSPSNPVGDLSSQSLERSHKALQTAYAEALERLKTLEPQVSGDLSCKQAVKELERSLAEAVSERDVAHEEVALLRRQTSSLRNSERTSLDQESVLSKELLESARRIEELSAQVRQQMATNETLRQRLASTINRGDEEQKANAKKIMILQGKLKSLEDQLLAAQNTSDERLAIHEEDIRSLKESHNLQLRRLKDAPRASRLIPLSPILVNAKKPPRITSTSSGNAASVAEDLKIEKLKQKVTELERALSDADRQMEEVVGRMNVAQIEVIELQNEREEAVRETKQLQEILEVEKAKVSEGRWAFLG